MPAILTKLVGAAMTVASFGRVGAAVILAAGLVVLLLGRRTLRPAAAALAAGGGALASHLAMVAFVSPKSHELPLAIAGGAVLGAALGLAAPRLATILSGAAVGWFFAPTLVKPLGMDRDVVLLGTTLAGGIVPAALWHALPVIVPPLAGAALATLGAWAEVGATGMSPSLFHLPVAWLVVFGILLVIGSAAAKAAETRSVARAQAKSERAKSDEAKRRAADERARYARFLD